MTVPVTGIVFLFGSFVLLYLGQRFYKCWKVEENYIAKYFGISFFVLTLPFTIYGVLCLFLIENSFVWRLSYPLFAVFAFGGLFILLYIPVYLKFKKYSKLFFFLCFVTLTTAFISFVKYPPFYFFQNGVLNWELSPKLFSSPPGIIFSVLVALVALPLYVYLVTIFFREAKKAKKRRLRIRAFGLGLALIWAFLIPLTDFFLLAFFKVPPVFSDINYFIFFSVLLVTIVLTWKPPSQKFKTSVY